MILPGFKLYASNKVKIYNESERFLDIEAQTDQLRIDLSDVDKKNNVCLFSLDIFDGENLYIFYYRRPRTIEQCETERNEYFSMISKSKNFRIVGTGFNKTELEHLPKHFIKTQKDKSKKVKTTALMFTRLQVGPKCKAYFSTDCDLPQNYWAGTIPPDKK